MSPLIEYIHRIYHAHDGLTDAGHNVGYCNTDGAIGQYMKFKIDIKVKIWYAKELKWFIVDIRIFIWTIICVTLNGFENNLNYSSPDSSIFSEWKILSSICTNARFEFYWINWNKIIKIRVICLAILCTSALLHTPSVRHAHAHWHTFHQFLLLHTSIICVRIFFYIRSIFPQQWLPGHIQPPSANRRVCIAHIRTQISIIHEKKTTETFIGTEVLIVYI